MQNDIGIGGEKNSTPSFDDLWAMYPKKEGKKYASKCWERLTPEQKSAAVSALPTHLRKWDMDGRQRQYYPDLSTWINQERWEDEIDLVAAEPKVVAWWATEAGVMAKGREVGCSPRPGEDMTTYKTRVVAAMRRSA